MSQFFKSMDLYGMPVPWYIYEEEVKKQSYFGAVVTIVTLTITLIYLITQI